MAHSYTKVQEKDKLKSAKTLMTTRQIQTNVIECSAYLEFCNDENGR
jgi:hypothetical protein